MGLSLVKFSQYLMTCLQFVIICTRSFKKKKIANIFTSMKGSQYNIETSITRDSHFINVEVLRAYKTVSTSDKISILKMGLSTSH